MKAIKREKLNNVEINNLDARKAYYKIKITAIISLVFAIAATIMYATSSMIDVMHTPVFLAFPFYFVAAMVLLHGLLFITEWLGEVKDFIFNTNEFNNFDITILKCILIIELVIAAFGIVCMAVPDLRHELITFVAGCIALYIAYTTGLYIVYRISHRPYKIISLSVCFIPCVYLFYYSYVATGLTNVINVIYPLWMAGVVTLVFNLYDYAKVCYAIRNN